jgi:acetoacetate decarboxylase
MMPLLLGAVADRDKGIIYESVEMLSLQYKTEYNSVKALLPEGFEPIEKPTANIAFCFYDGVDYMAGRGYNIVFVTVAAKFNGNKDKLEGDYVLVIFENDAIPIITGRELLGAPKIFADIPSPVIASDGVYKCQASLWGNHLLSAEFGSMKKQNMVIRKMGERMLTARPWMTYKYIPSLKGVPDADYPVANWSDTKMDELWLGDSGSLSFGDPSVADIGVFTMVVDAVKSLPFLEVDQVSHWKGSQVLRSDRSRRLF